MATLQSTSSSGEGSERMDARLWGGLQDYVDLRMIYAKLPMEDFFRLRQVCKEWNRLASDRGFLLESFRDPIPSPYFVVDSRRVRRTRLLSYEASSRRWRWTRLPRAKCEVAGLLCEDSASNRVFNVHTRVFHSLPGLPPREEEEGYHVKPLIGMTADTSVSPFTFQVILGHESIGTRIYDSKSDSWTHKSSSHEFSALSQGIEILPMPTSVYCNGLLYIRVWSTFDFTVDLHTYDAEEDEWQAGDPWIPPELWVFCDVGAWQGRLFLFRMESDPDSTITAWENYGDSETEGNWTQFDSMPEDLCLWMLAGEEDGKAVEVQSKFCEEYVLVHNYGGLEEVTERAVLYNLDRKTWGKVELPDRHDRLVSSEGAARAETDL